MAPTLETSAVAVAENAGREAPTDLKQALTPADLHEGLAPYAITGRRAIVTGGSQGLGRAISMALAAAGADVAVVARTRDRVLETSDDISALGRRAFPFVCDVSDVDAARAAIDEATASLGGLDILVTAAGAQLRKPALDVTPEEFDDLIAVNLRGVYFCCQQAAKNMIATDRQHRAKIINIASLTAVAAWPAVSVYGATKGGVVQLTRAFAVEWAEHGINVNAIGPGTFHTAMTRQIYEDPTRVEQITRRLPLKRPGEPDDLTGATLLLASSASDYITGQVIWVDGGWLSG